MPPTRVAPEEDRQLCNRIGLFGIKLGNSVLLESLAFRYFAQASQIGLFRTECCSTANINVCFHIVISWITLLLYCILEHKDFNNLIVFRPLMVAKFNYKARLFKRFFRVFFSCFVRVWL